MLETDGAARVRTPPAPRVVTRVSPEWLRLREAADAAARAPELVEHLRERLHGSLVVHDLGSGTGSMGRWLAPQLPGRQHWILHDRDARLLAHAAPDPPRSAADGSAVTVETRQHDITQLAPAELRGASLITASALLDILTEHELDRLIAACTEPGCPVLITLSVIGLVELTPADPFDDLMATAFDTHQRRTVDDGRLLGPGAVDAAVDGFTRRGARVIVRPSPWRLDAEHADLFAKWFTGWVGAACSQQPALTQPAAAYARRRLAALGTRRLSAAVHHLDLLALH